MEIKVTDQGRTFQHELLLEAQAVSGLEVWDLTMRVGVGTVRMGGIGGVWTDSQHRLKGYSRRVLENSSAWMMEQGFDCATLFGISDYYHRFGYAPCLVENVVELPTRDAERASPTLAIRPFAPEDLEFVAALYAENSADLSGSIVRNEKTVWFQKGTWYGTPTEVSVFHTAEGEIVAYAVRDKSDERVAVMEMAARHPAYYHDVIRWAAERAVALRVEKVCFHLPPDHPMLACLMVYGAEQRLTYPRNGSGMGRLLRLEAFFEKTLPEWTRRVQQSVHPGASVRLETDIGEITLCCMGDQVVLKGQASAVGTVRLPQSRLFQLAMGYYSSSQVTLFPEVEAQGDLTLFHTLFPRRLALMWRGDHF